MEDSEYVEFDNSKGKAFIDDHQYMTEINHQNAKYKTSGGKCYMKFSNSDPDYYWEYVGKILTDGLLVTMIWHYPNYDTKKFETKISLTDAKFEFMKVE